MKIQNSRYIQLNIEKTRFELLRSERVLVYLSNLNLSLSDVKIEFKSTFQ